MDCSRPGSSLHEISQVRILEWISISYPEDLPDPGIEPGSLASPVLAGGFFTTGPSGKTLMVLCNVPNTGLDSRSRNKA